MLPIENYVGLQLQNEINHNTLPVSFLRNVYFRHKFTKKSYVYSHLIGNRGRMGTRIKRTKFSSNVKKY